MNPNEGAKVQLTAKSLTIERVYHTSPERLFQAWTDPQLVGRWLAPGAMKVSVPVYDVRKGGRWRIEMRGAGPDGQPMEMAYEGTFDDVTPGKRIVMLWPPAMPGLAPGADDPASVVTATFTPIAGGTLLRLTQDGMPNREGAENAAFGWEMAFENLAGLV